ncbi:glycoside hydrolase family 16 protein, partial [Mycolicibacterium vanbaalenii]|uniref:glycoside hydrolase family 16 protein n=1 Tax=Mycolicibacterium vanbaalenii TaxID=110539 RepID=UPI0021F27898
RDGDVDARRGRETRVRETSVAETSRRRGRAVAEDAGQNRGTRHGAAPAEVEPESVDEEPTDAVALRSIATADAAAADTTTTAVEVDPVLVAAATSTKVTWGSMIVDWLYSIGIRSRRMGTDWLDVPVSKATEQRWLVKRARIYRNVVIPQPDNPASPKLLWESNFSSMEEALRYWGLQTGRWGQSAGENQYYTDGDNVYIDADGNLVIEARREAAPDGLGAPYNYTSARVVTMGKQSIGVGTRVVARIQMPVDKGVLPAFWSVGLEPGHEYDWPRQGEIDIVEIPGLGTPAARRLWTGNIHGPAETDNSVDVKLHGVEADLGVDLSQGFHDYGMDWYSDRIVWHVDGVEVGRITQAQYEALGGNWTAFSGAWDHYLILNVAVGNPWTGDPDPNAPFQAQMKVDWVKAYAL